MRNWKQTFYIIWAGQFFSTLTSSIVSYAIIFWLSIRTKSAEVLAYSTLASMLPHLILGLFTGVFIDRWNRKKVMILSDLYIAAITVIMAFLFYFGNIHLWILFTLLAFRSIGSAFHEPAMEASVPLLAPKDKLMKVAGINNMIYSISTIASPAIAALFINLIDMTWVLMLDVIGALIACTSLYFVHIPNPKKYIHDTKSHDYINLHSIGERLGKYTDLLPLGELTSKSQNRIQEKSYDYKSIEEESIEKESIGEELIEEESIEKESIGEESIGESKTSFKSEINQFILELKQGILAIIAKPKIMWMFILTIFASLAMVPVSTLFPLMTLEHFAGDTFKMSLIEIAWGIGMLVGGLLISISKSKNKESLFINLSYVVLGTTFLLSGFLPSNAFYIFAVLSAIGGIAGAVFWGAFTVLLQRSIEPGVLGRVFSIHGSLIMIPAMFSLVATGYIADTIGITNTFICGGGALILIGAFSFRL